MVHLSGGPRQAARGGLHPGPVRSGSVTARRSTCCSRLGTRRRSLRSVSDRELRGRRMTRERWTGSPASGRPVAGGSCPSSAGCGRCRQPRSTISRLAWAAGRRRRGGVRAPARPATLEGRMTTVSDPWEHHATWWRGHVQLEPGRRTSSTSFDLLLVAQHLAGLERVLDLGSGEGQLAWWLAGQPPGPDCAGRALGRELAGVAGQAGADRYVRGVGAAPVPGTALFDGIVCCRH